MGYMRSHAIIVQDYGYGDWMEKAHAEAVRIFPWVSPLSDYAVNGIRSFFVPPDGSKEGWAESDDGDARRAEFLAWLKGVKHNDGSSPLAWVEVQFADDEHQNRITMAHDIINRR